MLLGSPPPRSAHRAAPDGPLTVLLKQSIAVATSPRRPPRRRARREPQRATHQLTTALGALIVAGICALSAFLIVADGQHSAGAEAAPARGQNLSSRTVDSRPLSLEEVFPNSAIRITRGSTPYTIGMTHIDTDCGIATTGATGPLLSEHGCTQVVRASMTAPYGGYRVTAGVFNLSDADGARTVDAEIRTLVETGAGSFSVLGGLLATDQPASSQVGWQAEGHFLLYCVIAKPDGELITSDDPYARRITADLVETYLGADVLGRRAAS